MAVISRATAIAVYDDVVAAVVPLWHDWFQARLRLSTLVLGALATAAPHQSADERAAMLEVRAGTGGDEAALFAGDLLRMYQRFAEEQGWKFELISSSVGLSGSSDNPADMMPATLPPSKMAPPESPG